MPNVYGGHGNRWWVGQNIGGSFMEQTVFGKNAVVPVGGLPGTPPAGYESLPSGNAADDAEFAAAAGQGGTVVVEGITWNNINGPYPSQAAANAAIPGIQAADPAMGEAQQAQHNATSGWTHNIEQWLVRGFEMLLGLGLIIVSLAKLASDTPAGRTAVKAGKAAAIL